MSEDIEKLKKAYEKAQKVYEDLAVEYYKTHYNTDKEYKALYDAQQAYNNAFDKYVLTALKISYKARRVNERKRDNKKDIRE